MLTFFNLNTTFVYEYHPKIVGKLYYNPLFHFAPVAHFGALFATSVYQLMYFLLLLQR